MIVNKVKEKWLLLVAVLVFLGITFLASNKPEMPSPAGLCFYVTFILIGMGAVASVLLLNQSYLNNFLIVSLLVGVFYIVLRPFSLSFDEEYHFMRAYDLTNGNFFPSVAGAMVPEGYETYAERDTWTIKTIWENSRMWFSRVDSYEFIERVRSASYLPFAYIPAALGIGISRILQLPLIFQVLFGRLCNYLFYVAVCAIAIARTPKFKSILFLLALSTGITTVFGAVHIDLCLISSILLFMAICFKYIFDEQMAVRSMEKKDIGYLIFSAFMISSIKYLGYVLILLFVLFIGKNVSNKKRVFLYVGATVLLVAGLQIYSLLKYKGSLDGSGRDDVNTAQQLQYILSDPIAFMKLILTDLIGNIYVRMLMITETNVGIGLISDLCAMLPIVGAIAADDKPIRLISEKKTYAIVVYCLVTAAVLQMIVSASLYVSWTSIGANYINNVQHRYTIPMYILVMTALGLIPVKNEAKRWPEIISFFSMLAILNTYMGFFQQL